jgi:hypothetical protein
LSCAPRGPETKNDCAGEAQEQYTGLEGVATETQGVCKSVQSHPISTEHSP